MRLNGTTNFIPIYYNELNLKGEKEMILIKQIILNIYSKFRNLILYGIIGIFSAGLDFIIFYALTTIVEVFYLIANVFSVTIGITTSFILNRKYNFKVIDKVFKRYLIFVSVGSFGLLLSSALLYFFIDVLTLDIIVSKVLSIVFVVLIQFFLNRYITFRKDML